MMKPKAWAWGVLVFGLAISPWIHAAGEMELLGTQTPWRVHLQMGPLLREKDGKLLGDGRPVDFGNPESQKQWAAKCSPAAPADWHGVDFDDSGWGRYQTDNLCELAGGYGGSADPRSGWRTRLCLRACFGVSGSAAGEDLILEIAYLGGVVVYLNSREVARSHVSAGNLDGFSLAEPYPLEAYVTEDGTTPLPTMRGGTHTGFPFRTPDPKWKDRYEKRVRHARLRLPKEALVKGRNVLALDLRHAAVSGPLGRDVWNHLGLHAVRLVGTQGSGAVSWVEAQRRTYIWNVWPMETVTEKRSEVMAKSLWWITFGRGHPTRGLEDGNPFDVFRPVRIAVPRNGTCAGVAVVSDSRGVRNVSAKIGALTGPGGATFKPESFEIRYAVQQEGSRFCDALLASPPDGARNIPIWLLANASKGQTPGWYTGTLTVSANGQEFKAPVQVLVFPFAVPDPRENRTMVGMIHSPDTVAVQYGVEPWSEKHFQLMEKTVALMGQLGSDVVHVPVLLHTYRGVQTGMVRWVKEEKGYRNDFNALETHLNLWVKHCGQPKALCLDMYSPANDPELIDCREKFVPGTRNSKAPPPKVTLLDPATGKMSVLTAPRMSEEGGEAFWRPVFDGVREIVKKRGWPEQIIMIGETHDSRPTLKFVEMIKQWAPYARWSVYSHFSGDSRRLGTKDRMGEGSNIVEGKWIILPGMEVGYGVMPFEHMSPLMMPHDENRRKMTALLAGTYRFSFQQESSPEAYRTVVWWTGNSGRHGMDYWLLPGGRRLFEGPGNIYGGTPISMTAPGSNGALPTVRFQMYREAVQEAEAWIAIVQGCANRKDAQAETAMALYRNGVGKFARGGGYGASGAIEDCVPLAKLSLGWIGNIARAYEIAGELTGAKMDAKWEQPPR
jgi:hypothetical protein